MSFTDQYANLDAFVALEVLRAICAHLDQHGELSAAEASKLLHETTLNFDNDVSPTDN